MHKKSGSLSIAILCSSAILAKYLIILPEYMVGFDGNAAWIEMICKCIIALLSFSLLLWLYKPLNAEPLDRIFNIAAGKFGSVVFSYIYIIGFTIYNAALLRILIEALNTVMATDAPDEYFAIFILSAVFAGAYHGIRSTSNLSIIIFPFVILSLVGMVFILIPHYRTSNIFPILGSGKEKLLEGMFKRHFGFVELVLPFFLAKHLSSYKEIKKSGYMTLLIVSVSTILLVGAYCLTVPYPASKNFFLPLYQMTRMIKAGTFLQRLEPLVVFVWTSFILCSISALVCIGAHLLAGTNKKSEKGFVPIVVLITFLVAMIPESEISAFHYYEVILRYGSVLFPTVPVVVTIIARLRLRREKTI